MRDRIQQIVALTNKPQEGPRPKEIQSLLPLSTSGNQREVQAPSPPFAETQAPFCEAMTPGFRGCHMRAADSQPRAPLAGLRDDVRERMFMSVWIVTLYVIKACRGTWVVQELVNLLLTRTRHGTGAVMYDKKACMMAEDSITPATETRPSARRERKSTRRVMSKRRARCHSAYQSHSLTAIS